MRWRSLFSRRTRNDEAFDAIRELLAGDALYNRAALSPETLRLYHHMFPDRSEAVDGEIAGVAGERFAQLVGAFAQLAGKPMPLDLPGMVAFLNEELRGFDTPEATELRERAVLDEMKRLLKG